MKETDESRPVGRHNIAVSWCRRDLVLIMQLTSLAQPREKS